MQNSDAAIHYHERTKHHFQRYARSLGYMDWANQPGPFRRYHGAPLLRLPFANSLDETPFDAVYAQTAIPVRPVDAHSIGEFFEYALALSAWKAHQGARWELRCNPSSGNLHPTEGYLVAELGGAPGVFHYAPKEHGLERRTAFSRECWNKLRQGFPTETFFIGLASIHWREVWKYGERAYRYCNHDVGHALAALSYSAATLGWHIVPLDALSDRDVAALLGIDREGERGSAEEEHPDLVAAVVPAKHAQPLLNSLPRDAIDAIAGREWLGRANRLSIEHVDWEIIPETAAVCRKPVTAPSLWEPIESMSGKAGGLGDLCPEERRGQKIPPVHGLRAVSAHRIFLQRRSAADMDGHTGVEADAFCRLLGRTLPVPYRPPWSCGPRDTTIHLALFVHRVAAFASGLYLLIRNPRDMDELRRLMRPDFVWQRPANAPGDLPLFLLREGDYRRTAVQVSCMQDIAGDGAFSLGMIARFEAPIREQGAWMYPRLFWEAGMIGQVIYLEAEAAGLRGTGIGCYFDDGMHDLLGLKGTAYQSLYHFAVGGPVDDSRLRSLPPYSNERRTQSDL